MVGLLNHRVDLCLTLWENSKQFSKAVVPFYTCTIKKQEIQLLHKLHNIYIIILFFFNLSHSTGCNMTFHYDFNLCFPEDQWFSKTLADQYSGEDSTGTLRRYLKLSFSVQPSSLASLALLVSHFHLLNTESSQLPELQAGNSLLAVHWEISDFSLFSLSGIITLYHLMFNNWYCILKYICIIP